MSISRALVVVLVGCASTPAPAPSQPASTGGLEQLMSNCPSAVRGSFTQVSDAPDGVFVYVTAGDEIGEQRIRALGNRHAQLAGPEGNAPQHTGLHGGPGDIGYCPIIHSGTRVSFTSIGGGVRFHVRALDPALVSQLRVDTRARVEHLPVRIANH